MSHALQAHTCNRLLASLPEADAAPLASAMRIEHPFRGRVLASRIEPPDEVWFPHDGVVALTATGDDGRAVQTGVVGSEGCIGVETLLDNAPPISDAAVQIEGNMSVISVRQLRAFSRARPSIRFALATYLYGLCAQSLQIVACNRLHALEQRCCGWLLIMRDRTGSADLPLTQESLANLLGGGRPRINKILGRLERMGLLHRQRGRIRLLDNGGLERRACECFRSIHKTFETMDPACSSLRTVS